MAEEPHSGTRSEDSYNYSDDFSDDDDDPAPVRSAQKKEKPVSHASKARGRGQGRGRGKGRGHSRHSQAKSDTQIDVVTKRLLSASQLRMKELQNQLHEMKKQLKTVKDENRLFKQVQYKQERALRRFEGTESELPQMIQAHNSEVRSLKEQLRRAREKYDKTDRYLRDAEDELEKMNAQMKKYKGLSEQKNLGERSELDRRLNKAEVSLEEKTSRVEELERHLEMVKKNHRHELGIERARAKEAQKQIEDMKDEKQRLEMLIKEKEKMLEAKNIYSNRFLKPSSYSGTPAHSPPLWRQSLKKKSGSLTDLSSRDKAKAYEDKRKAEAGKKEKPIKSQESKQKQMEEEKENKAEHKREDSEAEFWRRQEERYKQDQLNREKQEEDKHRKDEEEREQARVQQQREKMQRELEERERAEREAREADERDRRERERKEELERKEREERVREQKEKEERERKEAEQREIEKREQELRAREQQENEARLAEERRKKEELLRRLQQMDGTHAGSQPSSDPFAPSDSTRGRGGDPFASASKRRLARTDSDDLAPHNKKDYTFTQSVENLHKGKPSHNNVSVPYIDRQRRIKAAAEDSDVGGYQPSFTGPIKPTGMKQKKPMSLFDDNEAKPAAEPVAGGSDKKTKLMADLFGSVAASDSKKNNGDDLFLGSKPAASQRAQNKRTSAFPWDNPTPSSDKLPEMEKRESSALFGGGAAVIEENDHGTRHSGANSSLLPTQSRQPATTFSTKPAVLAVDNFDDDIEEVVL